MLDTKNSVKNESFTIEKKRFQVVLDAADPLENVFKADQKNTPARNHIIIYSVLILGLIILDVMLFALQQKYNKDTRILKEKIEKISFSNTNTQLALKSAVRTKRAYKGLWLKEGQRAQALNAQVAQLLNSDMVNEKRIQARDLELARLNDDNSKLKNSVTRLSKEKDSLMERMLSLENIQDELQKKIKKILPAPKVELDKIVVTPSNLSGTVINANQKYNFVIVDLGKNDGMRQGARLMSYRRDKPIGEIIIEKIYDELSVGKAAFEWSGGELGAGDNVREVN